MLAWVHPPVVNKFDRSESSLNVWRMKVIRIAGGLNGMQYKYTERHHYMTLILPTIYPPYYRN